MAKFLTSAFQNTMMKLHPDGRKESLSDPALGEPSERIDKTDSHPHKSELRGVTLSQYIEYHNNSESRVAFQLDENVGPAFVKKDSSLLEKLGSIFSFGQHIARELDIQGVAHGELKTSTVFYSTREKAWKIGPSHSEFETPIPDLDDHQNSTADDIKNLGQLIRQLAVLQSEPGEKTPSLPTWIPEFIKAHLCGIINQFTGPQTLRPPASAAHRIFESYSQLLSLELVPLVFNLRLFPSYDEWTDYPSILPFNILMRFAEFYKEKKELRIASLFQRELLIWDGARNFEMTSRMLPSNFDIQRWHYLLSFDFDERIEKVEREMECDPSNPAPPLALMHYYASKGRFSDAINICQRHFVPIDAEKPLPLSEKSETFHSYPDRSGALKSFASRLFYESHHFGSMTLSHAAWAGNLDRVRDLLQRDEVSWIKSQPTPLFLAAWNMHTKVAEIIIEYRKDWIETPDELGFSPLHIAVQNNDCRLITALIGAGAQIEATTEEGATPLLLAADMGHVKAAEILVNNDANLRHKDKEGWQAIHWAAQFGHLGILEYLCPKVVGSIPSEEFKANDWTTPMHCAAEVGHLHVVKLLIENGFEVAARNNKGQTPKILAQNNGYNNVVKALTEAEKNKRDTSRATKRRKIYP